MKKSSLWYNGCQKKKLLFQNLILCCCYLESLGLEYIKELSTRSPFVVRNAAMELTEVIKSNLVKKTGKSEAFAILTDEATDISNMQQPLTFIWFRKKCCRYLFCNYLWFANEHFLMLNQHISALKTWLKMICDWISHISRHFVLTVPV